MMHSVHSNSTIPLITKITLVIILLCTIGTANSQELDNYDSILADYQTLDSLLLYELENDSSSLFSILEDILNDDYLKSQLSLRLGYTSDITNAGRNFGVQQFGLNAGVAFYHKSGFFADISGYYNSDQAPKYNTTITSLGYMGLFTPKWNYYLSYDHFFYSKSPETDIVIDFPLTNGLNGSTNYTLSNFNLGLDYSFMFGTEIAHRVRLNLGYSLYSGKVGFIDRIGFNPNISALAGNANVTTTVFNREIAQANSEELIMKIGRAQYFYLLRNNRELLKNLLSEEQTNNTFGILNYSIFVPVSFSVKRTTLLINYSLNFPVALPGEVGLDTSPNSYFSATFLYTFSL